MTDQLRQGGPGQPNGADHLDDELISRLVDGDLPPAVLRAAATHLAGCDACAVQVDALRSTVLLLRGLPSPRPSRSFQLGPSHARQPSTWRQFTTWLLPALPALRAGAVALVLVLGGIAAFAAIDDDGDRQAGLSVPEETVGDIQSAPPSTDPTLAPLTEPASVATATEAPALRDADSASSTPGPETQIDQVMIATLPVEAATSEPTAAAGGPTGDEPAPEASDPMSEPVTADTDDDAIADAAPTETTASNDSDDSDSAAGVDRVDPTEEADATGEEDLADESVEEPPSIVSESGGDADDAQAEDAEDSVEEESDGEAADADEAPEDADAPADAAGAAPVESAPTGLSTPTSSPTATLTESSAFEIMAGPSTPAATPAASPAASPVGSPTATPTPTPSATPSVTAGAHSNDVAIDGEQARPGQFDPKLLLAVAMAVGALLFAVRASRGAFR